VNNFVEPQRGGGGFPARRGLPGGGGDGNRGGNRGGDFGGNRAAAIAARTNFNQNNNGRTVTFQFQVQNLLNNTN
jgi:hypothetical protein